MAGHVGRVPPGAAASLEALQKGWFPLNTQKQMLSLTAPSTLTESRMLEEHFSTMAEKKELFFIWHSKNCERAPRIHCRFSFSSRPAEHHIHFQKKNKQQHVLFFSWLRHRLLYFPFWDSRWWEAPGTNSDLIHRLRFLSVACSDWGCITVFFSDFFVRGNFGWDEFCFVERVTRRKRSELKWNMWCNIPLARTSVHGSDASRMKLKCN